MTSLAEDLDSSAVWISKALSSSGYVADFSPASLRAIARFFDDHSWRANRARAVCLNRISESAFAANVTLAAGPLPQLGVLADVTAMSWQYRPLSDDDDGMYIVAVADHNAVVLLQVASHKGNRIVDHQLARPAADILNTALQLVRTRDAEGAERVSHPAAAFEESRPPAATKMWSDDALDGVAWHRLSHAHGAALGTPEHLRGLTAAGVATRRSACCICGTA